MGVPVLSRPDPVEQVVADLRVEFGESVPELEMREVAKIEVEHFRDATVRDFVTLLAWRRARQRMRGSIHR